MEFNMNEEKSIFFYKSDEVYAGNGLENGGCFKFSPVSSEENGEYITYRGYLKLVDRLGNTTFEGSVKFQTTFNIDSLLDNDFSSNHRIQNKSAYKTNFLKLFSNLSGSNPKEEIFLGYVDEDKDFRESEKERKKANERTLPKYRVLGNKVPGKTR